MIKDNFVNHTAALATRRAELLATDARFEDEIKELMRERISSSDKVTPEGSGDPISVELEALRNAQNKTIAALNEVREATARIEDGSYGLCVQCKNSIAPARLEVLPESTRCVNCASGAGSRFMRR